MILRFASRKHSTLSSFIQKAAEKMPNKDQINTEEARTEGKGSMLWWGQTGTGKMQLKPQ